jgi:predicted TIM-barrel fold metal-dependent hydrolase
MAEQSSSRGKIDVHAHHVPPGFVEDLTTAGVDLSGRVPPYPQWSVAMALEKYEKFDIATGILSIAPPGVHHGDDGAARRLARKVNEAGANAVRQHPERFGLFAELPLPDVDGALAEIAYAFDVLHADGIALKTNARGIYLGDSRFDPVFGELNRRKAVVFIHPISPACFEQCGLSYPPAMLEFPFDSARAVTNLILSGTLERCPDLRLIVPHNGGVLPFLARRIALFGDQGDFARRAPQGVLNYLRRIHYDTAMSTTRHSLSSLRELVDISQIVYGSDWPLMPEAVVSSLNEELAQSRFFNDEERRAVYRDNALRLFPRIAAIR